MLESGYIKLYRSLLNWEWYDDINTKTVFLHLLLTVSIEESKWHGITIKRGSRVSSYAVLAKETRLTERQVRTAISHLETTGQRQGNDKVATGQRQQYKKIEEDKECIYLSILDAESQNFPPTLEEIRLFAEQEKIRIDVQKFYDYYTERDWKTKNGNFIRNWKKTLQYWGETEGTPHKGKKQQDPPVSENAAAYASLIYNLDEPI